MHTVAVLGAGSFGTAVAIQLAKRGHHVLLWARDAEHFKQMKDSGINQRYLPDIRLPKEISAVDNLAAAVSAAEMVVVAVPSHAFVELIKNIPKPPLGLAWLTKGLDPSTRQLLSESVARTFGADYPIAVISGPSFAREVAQGLPTAVVIAGNQPKFLNQVRDALHHENMRVYLSDDWMGVQWCGAIKNILAIACGISDGLHYGANAKAALITRGLAEMTRFGLALGASTDTFLGLAGVGDLVLTCTDNQSRNRRFGLLLSEGQAVASAEKIIGQVVEGKHNAAQICALAAAHQIDMPICQEVNSVLQGLCSPDEAVKHLMQRPPRDEG